MKMRFEQFASLQADYRIRHRRHIFQGVRQLLHGIRPDISEPDALRRIALAIEDGKAIGMYYDRDLIRFAALAFLPDAIMGDPRLLSAMIRVLNQADWAPDKRLDFIYNQIISQPKGENSGVAS